MTSTARPAAPQSSSPTIPPSEPVSDFRYPGAPPFNDTELGRLLFCGRAAEIDEVLHSILSFDLFLVYAISGLGKTSLLRAGVAEPLRERGYFPVMVRLNDPTSTPVELVREAIEDAAQARTDTVVTRHPSASGLPAMHTLWDLLAVTEVWQHNTLMRTVLVLDQFEELFTLGWDDAVRAAFIEQLGDTIRRYRPASEVPAGAPPLPPARVKVVIVMREDFVGELEALAASIPQVMAHRFRLDGLSPAQAELAIREPAQLADPRLGTPRFQYSSEAASTILSFLGAREERGRRVGSGAVDPSQLQIICQHVERSIVPRKLGHATDGEPIEIDAGDLGGSAGLERILSDFYGRELARLPVRQRRLVRHLCERGLINQRGRRLSLEEGEIVDRFKVPVPLLETLVSRRMLRSEPRVGSVYYELAHDTLAGPIDAYRRSARLRRRRWLVAGGVIAVIAAVVAAMWAIRYGGAGVRVVRVAVAADGSTEVTPDAQNPVTRFDFDVADGPVVIEAAPATDGLDVDLQVSFGDQVVQSRRWGAGEPERIVVQGPATGGPFQAFVDGDVLGEMYRFSVRPLSGIAELHEGDDVDRTLPEDGFDVFRLDPSEDVVVTARATSGGDAIGIDGLGRSAGPSSGREVQMLFVVTDEPEFVAVRNPVGGEVAYTVSAERAVAASVELTSPMAGVVAAADPIAAYEFEAPESGEVSVAVRPDRSLDPIVLVVDGESRPVTEVDSQSAGVPEIVPFEVAAGTTYRIFVTGYQGSTGGFDLIVDHWVKGTAPPAGSPGKSTSGEQASS